GSVPGGESFAVLDGPVCADGFNWWQVDYGGQVGWTVEGSGSEYFLLVYEPPTPTPTPGPVQDFVPPLPYDNQLAVGARARVINDLGGSDVLQLRLHADPGLSTPVTGLVFEEALVTIEDGPQEADGLRWWLVSTEDGQRGWMIEGQPLASQYLAYQRTLLALCTTTEGDRVAFIGREYRSRYTFDGYIYTANLDGSSPCIFDRLKLASGYTTWIAMAYLPWALIPSPDGQQIAYVDQPDHDFLLYVMRQDGTRQRLTDSQDVWWVDWSPDGSRLLFTLGDAFNCNVWTQRVDGSARGALTSGAGSKSWAAWLPDSETVVYVEQYGMAVQVHGPTETILWRVNVQSGGLTELIRLTDDVRDMQLSPDGRYVLISGYTQQLEPYVEITGGHTLVLDVASGAVVFESEHIYNGAFWSQDSQYLIYFPNGYPSEGDTEPIVLEYVPVFGGEGMTVTTGFNGWFSTLRWLDDEHALVRVESGDELAVLNMRTGDVTAVADFALP
ncbi:MAG: hypothetical protein JW910_03425, partial [Anaerolineae bacterium]|nr:hypothetical protein [Anaerolineae bacterium]